MKLYYFPGACSLAPHIALCETGLKFSIAQVDLATKKTSDGEDYTRINPKGYVPALRLENGMVLTENLAVLESIADLAPAAKLAPATATIERYPVREWLAFIGSELHKNFGPFFSPKTNDGAKEFAIGNLSRRFDWLNGVLGSRNFLHGTTFTIADAYLFTVLGWTGHIGLDLAKWPNLARYRETHLKRPAVQAAMRAEGLIK